MIISPLNGVMEQQVCYLTINWSQVGKFSLLDRCHTCARMVFQQFKLVCDQKKFESVSMGQYRFGEGFKRIVYLYLAKQTKKLTLVICNNPLQCSWLQK